MIKKFSNQVEVWTKYGLFLMKNNRYKTARGLMQRSLQCLTKTQRKMKCVSELVWNLLIDVEVISKFALLEFKYGEMERGCTIFENLLSSYPRRIDLWSIYIDMLIKHKELDRVR